MISLPFLYLPSIPQDLIIRNFDHKDILLFSLISKKCHFLAKRFRVHVERLECAQKSIDTEKKTQISRILFQYMDVGWTFLQGLPGCLSAEIDNVTVHFEMGTKFDLYVIYETQEEYESTYEAVCKRLTGILKVKQFEVDMTKRYCWRVPCGFFPIEIDFDSETLEIHSTKVKSEYLKALLSKWKKGWFPRLKEVSAEWQEDLEFPWRMGKKNEQGQVVLKNKKGYFGILELKLEPSRVKFIVNPTN